MITSLNAYTEADWTQPRVRLDYFTDTDVTISVVRLDPDGASPVRGADALVVKAGAPATFYDFESPFGIPIRYVAADADRSPGGKATTGAITLNPTAWYPNDVGFRTNRGAVWLKHLTNPALSMPIDLSNAESPQFKQTRSVVDVLNRRSPIVVADARRKQLTSTLDIRTWTLEEAARVREILADNSVLLLDVPAAERWGITHWYITVGDVTEERLWQEWAPFEGRVFHLPVEIVDRPAGGVVYPACCYAAEQRGKGSYYDFDAAHETYAKLASCYVPPVSQPVDPDPGDTGKPGLRLFTSPIDDETEGEVRGPGYWQSTPQQWNVNTFTVDDPAGEEIWFFAQYNIRSSQQPMTIAVLLAEGTTFPLAGQVGPLISSSTEDPIAMQTLISVTSNGPLLVPQGTYTVAYVLYSNGTWVEAERIEPGEIRYASGVFLYSDRYAYHPGEAPEIM